MMPIAEVKTRLEGQVLELNGAMQEAVDFAALVEAGQLPQRPVAGFVLPAGLDFAPSPDAATAFTQGLNDIVAVVLVLQAPGDATARRALPKLEALIGAVINAICGWAPGGEAGVFEARRGRLLSVNAGAVFYQLDFAISDQLRVT